MSETRDLGVPVVVLLAGIAVLAWNLAAGTPMPGGLAGAVGVLGAGGALALTLRGHAARAVLLAAGSLLLLAAFSPAFRASRLTLVPWAMAGLASAFALRRLPPPARVALLAGSVACVAVAVVAVLSSRASLRPVAGLALAGAFACALNVFTTRSRPPPPAPVGPAIGVFGGSFDPFHAGHRAICEAALKSVSRLLVVVAARPPHKAGARELTPFHHRVAMARLGVEGLARTEVLEIENRREGPSYTTDTLETLRGLYPPGTTFYLVLGGDSLQDFPLWHDWERILERASLLVAARPGHDLEPPPEFEGRNAPITRLEMSAVPVSSTDVRDRIARGESPGDALSPSVAAYVRDHGLYREGATPAAQEAPEGPGAGEGALHGSDEPGASVPGPAAAESPPATGGGPAA